jgi:hypothetical protein
MTIKEALQKFGQHLEADRLDEAGQIVQMLTEASPREGSIRYLRGILMVRSGRRREAIGYFEQACALSPEVPQFREMLGITLLATGNWERGWELYEWRYKAPESGLARAFSQPQWTGQDLLGKTVLLHAEGRGHGDAIQFCRYVPMVAARGARVVLECQRWLVGLLSRLPGVVATYARTQPLPPFDLHSPLNSLPLAFKTTVVNVPSSVPYLAPSPERVEAWRGRLGAKPAGIRLRVGLVWAGTQTGKDFRSRSLSVFAPLAVVAGVEFHSLQVGPEANETPPAGLRLFDHSGELRDFDETAALLMNLDLVISVDTAVAHLAGALAREDWVLLPKVSDFRWLMERNDSPWYPTMRLFRQSFTEKDWSGVVCQIAEELRGRAARSSVVGS